MSLPGQFNSLLFVVFLAFMPLKGVYAADISKMRENPFELPMGIYSSENPPEELPQTLQLQAIFNIKGKRIATISGVNFVKGDFAFGKQVVNITDNYVTLNAGGKEEVLILESKKFKIQKHPKK